jgi:hypothetical protein
MHECNLLIHEAVVRMTKNEAVAKGLKELMPEVAREPKEGSP